MKKNTHSPLVFLHLLLLTLLMTGCAGYPPDEVPVITPPEDNAMSKTDYSNTSEPVYSANMVGYGTD